MSEPLELHRDRLFSSEASRRSVARELYEGIKDLPIISPHGHTDPEWCATNDFFQNPYALLVEPDHYLLRMLYSQGVSMANMVASDVRGAPSLDPRAAWRVFAKYQYLFRGTPSGLWLDQVFKDVLGQSVRLDESTADPSRRPAASCCSISSVASTSAPRSS